MSLTSPLWLNSAVIVTFSAWKTVSLVPFSSKFRVYIYVNSYLLRMCERRFGISRIYPDVSIMHQ